MIATLLALAIAKPGPDLPAAASGAFQGAAIEVQRALQKGDFAKAEKSAGLLPKFEVSIEWDDRNVPAARQAEFRAARDRAVKSWTTALPDLKVTLAKPGIVKVSFVPSLPPNADSPGAAGAVHLVGFDRLPIVDSVLALKRTDIGVSAEQRDVENEVLFAIGSALGLGRVPAVTNAMARIEGPSSVSHRPIAVEVAGARANVRAANALRAAAAKKERLDPAIPMAVLETNLIERPPVVQGEPIAFAFSISNQGSGRLNVLIVPDCGCFKGLRYRESLAAGEAGLVQVVVDTTDFPGVLDKKLLILTNDPEFPQRVVQVKMRSDPRYRFLREQRGSTVVVDGETTVDVFLAVHPAKGFKVLEGSVDGAGRSVEIEPWSGVVADPALDEPPTPRKGYRIRVAIDPELPPGRNPVNIILRTDADDLPQVRHTLYVQRGIVALPASLYVGELGATPKRAWVLVSRPHRPFKIVRVQVDHPRFKAFVEPGRENWEYKVVVEYDGKAGIGPVEATLKIETDDAKQPSLSVPIQGVGR